MDSGSQENVYPAKRRKTEHRTGAQLCKSDVPSYITIAKCNFPVTPSDWELRSRDHLDNDILPMVLRSVKSVHDKVSLEVTAPWLKHTTVLESKCDTYTRRLLEDCSRLDSLLKVQKNPSKSPLVCYKASLTINPRPTADLELLWHSSPALSSRVDTGLLELLSRYLPSKSSQPRTPVAEPWRVQDFYDNVHVPEIHTENSAPLQIDLLHCELFPFQRRAVRWLLSREGVQIDASGQVTPLADHQRRSPILESFRPHKSADGDEIAVNDILGIVTTPTAGIEQRYGSIKGGLLGEAMGLGKTVEMIALMALHNGRTLQTLKRPATHLRSSPATLIITPPTILEQWRQEIQTHAPSLHVFQYKGMNAYSKVKKGWLFDTLCDQDVVLTTYSVIAKELYYVMEKPDRALRNRPRVEPAKSPLDQILWWRVCLDEAQMIESGVSAAATVARLIPRVNAWAVTGTPLRQHHKDLYGLMLFLRYEPWASSYKLWNRLISFHRPLFKELMREIALRHSKESVRDELRLPAQSRHTITISFTGIEQAHYSQLFYDMYTDCNLDRSGAPIDDEWDPNHPKTTEKMRIWLTRLRQTCVHPEVGGRNRKALGRNNGPLRTVQQVLDVMVDQTESALRTEQRTMLINKVRQGQMHENAKHVRQAMDIYRAAYDEATVLVEECRRAVELELATQQEQPATKDTEVESDDDGTNDSQQNTARQRLRSALEVKHICIFFMANIYFQMKSDEEQVTPESEAFEDLAKQESEAYEEAKRIRSELLVEVVRKANHRIASVRSSNTDRQMVELPIMPLIDDDDYGGIESRKIFDKLDCFCEAMNAQAEQFCELRARMAQFLQQALIDEDEGVELQGDEYENSTKHQDEMYAYMEAIRALFADRNDAITGQENLLIRSEMKQFLRAAKEGEGPAPELMIKLLAAREAKRINIDDQGSLRGIVAEVRALVSVLQFQEAGGSSRATSELRVANKLLQHANKLMSAQTKSLAALEQEVAHFRNSMNARLEYYKALQKISDTVAPYREEDIGKPIDGKRYRDFVRAEELARGKCSNAKAKQRYLQHLKNDTTSADAPRICTICQSEFEVGAITSCGHVFCKEDLQMWYSAHGNCPVCKRRLKSADFYDVTYKPLEMTVQAEIAGEASPSSPSAANVERSLSNIIYSDIGTKQLNEIKNVELRGASYGSKVDTIVRQLRWLRDRDPGSKTIIFSQFREVLDVLGRAFRQNAISYSRCDEAEGVTDFKSNPAIECFLLHAKAHSAGLNLVVASHVILCEPLINTALELQAIARVHRIGQHRATTVWMYLIADTVEEAIYDISVKRRLAHIQTRDSGLGTSPATASSSGSGSTIPMPMQESAIDAANSRELQAADLSKALAPGRNGGELVDKDDLWPCLFGGSGHKSAYTTGRGGGSGCGGAEILVPGVDRPADTMPADGEVARFLRAEAADSRRGL